MRAARTEQERAALFSFVFLINLNHALPFTPLVFKLIRKTNEKGLIIYLDS